MKKKRKRQSNKARIIDCVLLVGEILTRLRGREWPQFVKDLEEVTMKWINKVGDREEVGSE